MSNFNPTPCLSHPRKYYLHSFKTSEADVFKIRFVRIFDNELAADYSLYKMPCLVYFRNGIPVVYDGELKDESEVLEWLIQHQTSIDEEDIVENASKVRYRFTMERLMNLIGKMRILSRIQMIWK
jgi:hypothetical protein